ncbi:cell division protein ZapC domain-containing protein [Psychromonas sp.]|uniref:cell division protein ZapC domain-containing protein n=1 Tax=Psychromonas sp. TaxID=1884585 RepID=UPI003569C9A7
MCKPAYPLVDFRPQANWHWLFDQSRATLTLDMGNSAVDISYKSSMLTYQFDKPVFFTIEDVACYIDFFEDPALDAYSPAFRCKLILHILAVRLFHKPIMPKNWLFDSHPGKPYQSARGDHVILISSAVKQAKTYFVLDNSDDFLLCMLVEKSHALTPCRTFNQFQIVKVAHDKIAAKKS